MDNELDYLDQYIEDARQRIEHRRQLRDLNLQENIVYPDESTLKSCDSSIKKNSAFVKKLKTFSEGQKSQILDEIDRLNLTKFISEAAASITEAKFKLADLNSIIEVCTKLNRSYRDFHRHLLTQYTKCLPNPKRRTNVESNNSQVQSSSHGNICGSPAMVAKFHINRGVEQLVESSIDSSKLRTDLRIFAELLLVGILPLKEAFQVLANSLYYYAMIGKQSIHNASAILTLCKSCGDELFGLIPARVKQLSIEHQREIPVSDFIIAKRQTILRSYVEEFFNKLTKHLCITHQDLIESIARSQKICKLKGGAVKEIRDSIETKCIEFQKLENIFAQLAHLLDEELPRLEKPDGLDGGLISIRDGQYHVLKSQSEDEITTQRTGCIWDDDGARSFYEDLIDLKQLFPHLNVRFASSRAASEDSLNKMKSTLASGLETSPDVTSDDRVEQRIDQSTISSSSDEDEMSILIEKLQKTSGKSLANRSPPEQFFVKLSNCVNRDMIDNAAIDFIKFFNTKAGRKKLIKTLFNVQRTRLDLLPFFARLTATLSPYVPNVGIDLANLLKSEFKYLFKKKDQINIESKIKNVRYIGEFVKFDLISKQDAISFLKFLLSDFTHHHIEMTCNLLETCGRLLYRSSDIHHQIKLILEQMMRKKMLLSIDSKYVTMIENAYYSTSPPESIKQVIIEPPIQSYVRYLLYEQLDRSSIDLVLRKLKLLNWDDKELAKFVINLMIEAHNVKFYNIRYFAALIAALNKDRPWISIAVIDGVVEDILIMMEVNEIQFNQRRIPMIRYFGELFNYRLSDSSLVFKILYSLITYGVIYPDPEQDLNQVILSSLDPSDSLFRIKLVCDLLDTSGPYLNGSQEKRKLDCYLLFFQRYYWCKRHIFMLDPNCLAKNSGLFPAQTEYLYNDTIFNLRPQFQMATSYGDAIRYLQCFIDKVQNV